MNLKIIVTTLILFASNLILGQIGFELKETQTEIDSIVDKKDGSYAIGPVIQNSILKGQKFGFWKEFYTSGELKGEGLLIIGSYIQCSFAGHVTQYYSYKTGNWKYYHQNGKIKATGTYETQIYNYPTSCKGGYDIIIQKVGKFWNFYTLDGIEIKGSKQIIKELEVFYTSYGKHSP